MTRRVESFAFATLGLVLGVLFLGWLLAWDFKKMDWWLFGAVLAGLYIIAFVLEAALNRNKERQGIDLRWPWSPIPPGGDDVD